MANRPADGPPPSRRQILAGLGGVAAASLAGSAFAAPATQFFRIATGAPSGTYFPIGALIAGAISNPPGGPPCEKGGSCGVPGLIAVALASSGSVENVNLLRGGGVEMAFAQSDVAFWALTGTGVFAGNPPFEALRSIGALYTETVHLVVRADSAIRTPADLKGRVVSVGEAASGTLADARVILDAHGLTPGLVTEVNLRLGSAAEKLAAGEIDAFFILGGAPLSGVVELATAVPIRLVPLDGEPATALRRTHRFFHPVLIAGGTYPGVADTATLGVAAELVTTERQNADLIHAVCRALWNDTSRRLLAEGHPRGASFSPAFAANVAAIPLHAGAERFYRETGILREAAAPPAP